MKKILLPFAAFAIMASCTNAPTADKAETGEKETASTAEGLSYSVDTSSTITWGATKATGAHKGTFKLKEGSLTAKEGVLTAGSFIIDIASINNTDLAGDIENKQKLEGHLKSPDFFDATKYPTAKFEITSVEPFNNNNDTASNAVMLKGATHTIKGNLTLKDSTKNVMFPAIVTINGDKVTAVADFNIDRTAWGLNYKGPKNPADWIIRKEVNLALNISASKK